MHEHCLGSAVVELMSAFPESGRSNTPKSTKSKVRFRPIGLALVRLLHLDLDVVVEFPRAVEGRRCRTIDAESGPPSFARDGLDPHAFFARRSLWAEVERVGTIVISF